MLAFASLGWPPADQRRDSRQMSVPDSVSGPLDSRHLGLVINTADPLSEAIGIDYQRRRGIPEEQVIRVRLPVGQPQMSPEQFQQVFREVQRWTIGRIQVYALAWTEPYQVGCLSITTAFAFGYDQRHCANGCQSTRVNPYFANSPIRRPWDALRMRPTMLLAGTNRTQIRQLIDRGVAADGSAPAGTGYLLSTSDSARNVRAQRFETARLAIGPAFQVRILQRDVLRDARGVMFYFTGLADVPGIDTNDYRPGAVADHLTSFGGQITGSSQMSALRWLEAGVTGSYGTVVEPCNIPAKFPDPGLLMVHYLRGSTLIEAYWSSVQMPGQGVFIGEPLARPWRRPEP